MRLISAMTLGALGFGAFVPGFLPEAAAQRAAQPAPAAASTSGPAAAADTDHRSEAYFNITMAHLYQQEYVTSNRSEDANRAIDFYKKAYAVDPTSPVIGEQLAEMYFSAQRIQDAVLEAKGILRRDPSNVPTRRLLARIYIRTLGDLSKLSDQQQTAALAIEQLQQIFMLDPSDTASAVWLARLQRLTGQNDQAEKVLRAILVREPDNQNAMQQLTQLLLEHGKPSDAVTLLQETIQRAPTAALYIQLGDAFTQVNQPDQAEQAYRHAVEIDPAEPAPRRALAQALFDRDKMAEAAVEYERLVEIEPEAANNHLRLSEIYRRTRQLDKAEQQVLLAKQRAPGNLEVIYNQAAIYETQERFEDAIRVLSDAVTGLKAQNELADSSAPRRRTLAILYQLLGQLYRDTQNYTAAINTFEEMLKLGPEEDRRARLLIVESYRSGHQLPQALDETKKALAAYPNDRSMRLAQALLYGDNNQIDQAVQILKGTLGNSPADLEVYFDLAQVYEHGKRFGDAEQAIHSAEKFLQRPEDRATAGLLLGGIFVRQKKYDQAEQVFKSVLAIDPANGPVLNYYGYMLAERGTRLDEAVALVQRALVDEPNNPAYLDSVGWAYYKQDKLMEAEAYVRKALTREPHDPTMISHLGDILAKSGRTDLAATEWEKSVAEWHRAVPAEFQSDKVAELEQKIASAKHRTADQKQPSGKNR